MAAQSSNRRRTAWRALFQASAQRRQQGYARIEGMLQVILHHFSGTRDAHIKKLVQQLSDQRREAAQYETHLRIRRLEAELEHSLPADVPLHKRGFGVMDDPEP